MTSIADKLPRTEKFLAAWSDVWPILRQRLTEEIVNSGASASTAADLSQAELSSQRTLCQLLTDLNKVGTDKKPVPPAGPIPLKPTY